MAEIGIIASIVGVAAAGAKVSLCLYQFADEVGSAGEDVRRVAVEISLFCSVLRQLDSTLRRAKATRYSLNALAAAEQILGECKRLFTEIGDIIARLQQDKPQTGEPSMNLVSRVKWTFKRSRVSVLRSTLESMKTTLHLMLTTLDFAEKVASRRISTAETDREDVEAGALAESLLITQQVVNANLVEAEEQEAKEAENTQEVTGKTLSEDATELASSPSSPYLAAMSRKRANRSSQLVNGLVHFPGGGNTHQPGNPIQPSSNSPTLSLRPDIDPGGFSEAFQSNRDTQESKRASLRLAEMVFDEKCSLFIRPQTWDGDSRALEARLQFKQLLQKWVQRDPAPFNVNQASYEKYGSIAENPDEAIASPMTDNKRTNVGDKRVWTAIMDFEPVGELELALTRGDSVRILHEYSSEWISCVNIETLKSGLCPRRYFFAAGTDHPLEANELNQDITRTVEIFKSFRVSMDTPTFKVLPEALKKYNIDADWRQYALYISYGDQERLMGWQEQPLAIFKQLEREGKKPIFELRRRPEGSQV